MRRRVVVSGIGAVTPLGHSFLESWQGVLTDQCGATTLVEALHEQQQSSSVVADAETTMEFIQTLPCQVAAPVRGLVRPESQRKTARFVQLALLATRDALASAHWKKNNDDYDPVRVGVSIGCGLSSVAEIARAANNKNYRKLSPYFVPRILNNMAAGMVSMQHNFQGPNLSSSTACAAGAHAIGEAYRMIQYGSADAMVAGGTESCIDPLSVAGFCRIKALVTNYNDRPSEACRPFDKDRSGFVMGEGSCVLILEEYERAKARRGGTRGLVELVGYGCSGDAHHITAPDGQGAVRCMQQALADVGEAGSVEIDYVNAHATSTPVGDVLEARAIETVLPSHTHVSSTKGALGHLLGATGAIEAALTVQALLDNTLPHTRNLHQLDDAMPHLNFVRDQPFTGNFQAAMSNSFGFGGTNACLVFRKIAD